MPICLAVLDFGLLYSKLPCKNIHRAYGRNIDNNYVELSKQNRFKSKISNFSLEKAKQNFWVLPVKIIRKLLKGFRKLNLKILCHPDLGFLNNKVQKHHFRLT